MDGYIKYTDSEYEMFNLIKKVIKIYKFLSKKALRRVNEFEINKSCKNFWNTINCKTIVYDLIYNPSPTPLLKFCDKKGCKTIDGTQMLIAQGAKSLSFWTNGLEVPFEIMHDALKKYL